MAKAKFLNEAQLGLAIDRQLSFRRARQPLRDAMMAMLSFRAGLRAQEIAYLEVRDITDVEGNLAVEIHVTPKAAKYGDERFVPMSHDLRRLLRLYLRSARISSGPLFVDQYGKPVTPNAVSRQLGRMYDRAGLKGASSHSGRRTFITRGLREARDRKGLSIVDVQRLAGHAWGGTTLDYGEPSENQVDLVNLIAAAGRRK